jgi:large subunit ribosomal protein L4
MPTVDLFNREGQKVGDIQLSENVFAVEVNESVLHQVVVAQLANKRQGTQSTKTRAEVSGVEENLGDKKEQVEQTRINKSSTMDSWWYCFCTKTKSYRMSIPKSMRRVAMKSALSSKLLKMK